MSILAIEIIVYFCIITNHLKIQFMKTNKNNRFNGLSTLSKTLVFTLITALTFASCVSEDPLEMGTTAPAFTLKSLDGDNVSLSDFNNKVVVLFFFGNNCPSCKAAAPSVESMLVTPFAKSTDYMVLGLDQWDGNSAAVQTFKTTTKVSFPLLLNASDVAKDYGTTYDRIVVIDKMGKIAFIGKQSAASDIAAAKAKVMELTNKVETVVTDVTDENKEPESTAEAAPAFTLKSLDGTDVSLSNFSNKVVTLFFFGNNCSSCKAIAPSIQSKLLTPFADNNSYMVLGLDQWNGNQASVQAFKAATGVTFPLLLNASAVASSYKTTYDRIVVIDKMGKIAFSGKQLASSDIDAAKAKVMELLSK
jgi:peroxiredoxin